MLGTTEYAVTTVQLPRVVFARGGYLGAPRRADNRAKGLARCTVNIQNFGAAKFRHFTISDISAAIYFRRGVEGMV